MRGGAAFFAFRLALLLVILGLFFIAQRFWYRRGMELIARLKSERWKTAARVFVISLLLIIIGTLTDRLIFHFLPRPGIGSWLVGVVQLWLFASFFAFLLVKLVHVIEWLWEKATQTSSHPSGAGSPTINTERRAFFRYAAGFAGSLPLIAGAYGFARERLDYRVRRVDVPIFGLNPALDGLRIAQLSDIHIGDFMPADEIRRAVDMANALNPHLAVITGDFITGASDPLEDCIRELSRLRAPMGVFGCNGNHEIYADAEDQAQHLFRKHGMNLLRQQSTELVWQGSKLNLIGVDYQRERVPLTGSRHPMLTAIEPLIRRDMPNILLSHNPNSFYRAAELGIALSLAGHTHGGQVQVEIIDHRFSPARFMTRFIAGLYQLPSGDISGGKRAVSFLYVNRGLGTIGVPARLGVDPEITLLTLRAKPRT